MQSACFICTTWKRKQTMEQQPHHTCEQTKSKQKQNQVTSHSNWPRVLLFGLVHKQCNCIKVSAWLSMIPGHGANTIFFNKKIKMGRPEDLITPHPSTPTNISFLPYSPTSPLEVDVIFVSPLTRTIRKTVIKIFTTNSLAAK